MWAPCPGARNYLYPLPMRTLAPRLSPRTISTQRTAKSLLAVMALGFLAVVQGSTAARASLPINYGFSNTTPLHASSQVLISDLAYDSVSNSTIGVGEYMDSATVGGFQIISPYPSSAQQSSSFLIRLDAAGSVTELFDLSSKNLTAGALCHLVLPDGTIVIGDRDGNIVAIDGTTYAIKWNHLINPVTTSSGTFPSSVLQLKYLASTGSVYAVTDQGVVFALGALNGAPRWSYAVASGGGGSIGVRPQIEANPDSGVVYLTDSFDGSITAAGHTLTTGSVENIFVIALDGAQGTDTWATTFNVNTGGFSNPRILYNTHYHQLELWGNQTGQIVYWLNPNDHTNGATNVDPIFTVGSNNSINYATSSVSRFILDPATGNPLRAQVYGGTNYGGISNVIQNQFTGTTLLLGAYAGDFVTNGGDERLSQLDTIETSTAFVLEVDNLGQAIASKAIEPNGSLLLLPEAIAQNSANDFELLGLTTNSFVLNGTTIPDPVAPTPYTLFLTHYHAALPALDFPTITTDQTIHQGQLVPNQVLRAVNHPLAMDSGTVTTFTWQSKSSENGSWTDTMSPFSYYMVSSQDIGKYFRVGITATVLGGGSTTNYSNEIGPSLPPQPVITSIDTSYGSRSGGTEVTLHGFYFTNSNSVLFGGDTATIETQTSTLLTVLTPAHAAGPVDVSVTGPNPPVTLSGAYTYLGLPVLLAISRDTASTAGGETMTVIGQYLQGAVPLVDGQMATVINRASDLVSQSFTFTLPAHAAGNVELAVSNAVGIAIWQGGITYAAPTVDTLTSNNNNNSNNNNGGGGGSGGGGGGGYIPPVIPPAVTPTTTPTPATVDNSALRIKVAPTITKSGANLVCNVGSYEYGDTTFIAATPDSITAHLIVNGTVVQSSSVNSSSTSWTAPTTSFGIARCTVDVTQGKSSITADSLKNTTGLDTANSTWKSAYSEADSEQNTAKSAANDASAVALSKAATLYAAAVVKINKTTAQKLAALAKQKLTKKVLAAKSKVLTNAKAANLAALKKWLAAQQASIAATLATALATADTAHTAAIAAADSAYATSVESGSGAVLLAR